MNFYLLHIQQQSNFLTLEPTTSYMYIYIRWKLEDGVFGCILFLLL